MKVIITGATGMVGKGVLLECLEDDRVSEVLVVNRRSLAINHTKLREVLHSDFANLSAIENEMSEYDACFFNMGVTSIGKTEEEYAKFTYDIVAHWVETLYKLNPDLVFNYVSGQGTDSSEKGKSMWARIKGKAENYVLNKGFKDAYMFRPGMIIPEKGIKTTATWYSPIYFILQPFYPLFRRMSSVTTTTRIGQAMINSVTVNQDLKHLESGDINKLSSLS
ncbi:MAG: epimerase [Bacteroidetes bacterium]|nr:MAG: epimerase [Bacteroidota bacterium]